MQARVKWLDHMSFVGEAPSGHSIVMDGSPDHGGRNLGLRPMETVLLGLGGCSSFDVISYLRKARQSVEDCVVVLDAQRADSVPAVFTRIDLTYRIRGHQLSEEHVQRAVALSMEKYCSVSKMLEGSVEIHYQVELEDSAAKAVENSGGRS